MTLRELLHKMGCNTEPIGSSILDYDLIVHIEDSKGYEVTYAEAQPDHSIRLTAE